MTLFDDLYNIFIRPVADALGNILKPITDAINIDKITADITKAQAEADASASKVGQIIVAKSPIEPAYASDRAAIYSGIINLSYVDSVIAAMGVEAASLGQMDITPIAAIFTPAIRGLQDNAIAITRAELMEGIYPALQRYWRKIHMPMIPESYRIALAVSKGIIGQDTYIEAMMESGLSPQWAEVWQEQNYQYPNVAQAFELYWRGVITEETLNFILQRNGYRDDMTAYIKALLNLIPPASDIITMVVREAFDPRYVIEAPGIFAEYMAKKGFSSEWADRYWTAHFLPMAVNQAYDNLRRGYWDKAQFLEYLRIADIHPIWREDIYNVAFNPPSIREMGYGYDVGAYTVEDIKRYRRWGGLSEEDADKAAASMVAYRTEAERNAVRTEYMYLYGRGKIDRNTFESKLTELSTPAPAIALWLERADAYKTRITAEPTPEEPPSMTRSVAQYLFEHGIRNEDWLRAVLKDLGYRDTVISDFVAQSKFRVSEAKKKAEEVTARKLTLTQIRDLYKHGKIDAAGMVVELQKIDYSAETASRLADLIIAIETEPKPPLKMTRTDIVRLYELKLITIPDADLPNILANIVKIEGPNSPTEALFKSFQELGYGVVDAARLTIWTAIDVALPTLRAQYSKGWITPTQMYNALRELGLPDIKANEIMTTIVKASQPERTAPERDLTKAEIIKGAKQGILTPTQASELLQGIGYDSNEALYLLYINAVVSRGDPEGYWEMRKVVEQQKKARGEAYKEIPDELIGLELKLKEAKDKLEQLKKEKATEEAIGAQAVAIGNFETQMRVVIAKLKLQ